MADLLSQALERSIVETSTRLANSAESNHTSQLNNNARNAEVLGKRIVEWDGSETVAHAEGYTRVSPTSQPFHIAQGMSEIGGVLQNNQNYINQGYMQLSQQIEGLRMQIASLKS